MYKFLFAVLVLACANHCVECDGPHHHPEEIFKQMAKISNPAYVRGQALHHIQKIVANSNVDDAAKHKCARQAEKTLDRYLMKTTGIVSNCQKIETRYLSVANQTALLIWKMTDSIRKVLLDANKTCTTKQLSAVCLENTVNVRSKILAMQPKAAGVVKTMEHNNDSMMKHLGDCTQKFQSTFSNGKKHIEEGLNHCLAEYDNQSN